MPGGKKVFELFVRADEDWVFVTDLHADTKADALLLAVMVLKKEFSHLEMRVQEKSPRPDVGGHLN